MALSLITSISSLNLLIFSELDNKWGPFLFTFATGPNGLVSYIVESNSFTYTIGTNENVFKNGTYEINASSSSLSKLPHGMFDTSNELNLNDSELSNTSRWISGGLSENAVLLDGSLMTYNRASYIWNTGAYQGGRSDGTATWSTSGYLGEYFQIKFPFNYILTKIYMITSEITRGPKILYIFGSHNGSSWIYVTQITTIMTPSPAIGTNVARRTEYSYNVANASKYRYYRFVVNTIVGGWTGATICAISSFRTEGQAYQ